MNAQTQSVLVDTTATTRGHMIGAAGAALNLERSEAIAPTPPPPQSFEAALMKKEQWLFFIGVLLILIGLLGRAILLRYL